MLRLKDRARGMRSRDGAAQGNLHDRPGKHHIQCPRKQPASERRDDTLKGNLVKTLCDNSLMHASLARMHTRTYTCPYQCFSAQLIPLAQLEVVIARERMPAGELPESTAVRVAVRVRPLSTKERNEGCGECLRVDTHHVTLRNDKTFAFDHAFGAGVTQRSVYEQTAAPLVRKCFDGFNGTVFAYGQTGSGKTHTMGGSFEEGFEACGALGDSAGVIPRVVHEIFATISAEQDASPDTNFAVTVSFLEIYNECIRDLLAPAVAGSAEVASLELREDTTTRGGVTVVGLSAEPVTSAEQVYACLQRGGLRRATASTQMNAQSSRSHAICTIGLERRGGADGEHRWARLNLVDLAGSERQKRTKAEGSRLAEAISINKGLFVLGNVISALGDKSKAGSHVPYRNSKLTRLLQDSLGGNSHTVMIACCSPADSNFEETLNTLRYAHRTRNIKNTATVNKDPGAAELVQLRQQVQLLQLRLLGAGDQASGSNGSDGMMWDMAQLVEALDLERSRRAKLEQALEAATRENGELMAERDRGALQLEQNRQKLAQLGHAEGTDVGEEASGVLEQQLQTIAELRQKLAHATTAAASFAHLERKTGEESETSADSAFEQEQCAFAANLASLDASLEQKQSLMKALASGNTSLASVAQATGAGAGHCAEIDEARQQKQIETLTSERDALQKQLQSASSTADQRQKLANLEQKLLQAQQKLRELARLRRLTDQAGANVKKLQVEIDAAKRQRAEVQRRMHEAAMAHRHEQKQRKHELGQLQRKDQQKQVRLTKLELQHSRQSSVLQRKEAQIASVTRRLRAVMEQQKAASMPKPHAERADAGAACKAMVLREIDVSVTLELAKQALSRETESRTVAASRLRELQQKDSAAVSHESDVAELQGEVRERTALIAQLQDRLANFDRTKSSQLWNSIHTVREAKLRLRKVFDVAVESRISLNEMEQLELEGRARCEQLEGEKQDALEAERIAGQSMLELQQQSNAKLMFVLQKLPALGTAPADGEPLHGEDAELRELRDKQIESMSDLHERMCAQQQDTAAENDALRQQITILTSKGKLPAATKKKAKKVALEDSESDFEDWEESEEEEQWEDDSEDSDYEDDRVKKPAALKKKAQTEQLAAAPAAAVAATTSAIELSSNFEVASATLMKLTVAQLKDELRGSSLKVSGLKGELVSRILEHRSITKAHDDAVPSQPPAAPDAAAPAVPSPAKPLAPRVAEILAQKRTSGERPATVPAKEDAATAPREQAQQPPRLPAAHQAKAEKPGVQRPPLQQAAPRVLQQAPPKPAAGVQPQPQRQSQPQLPKPLPQPQQQALKTAAPAHSIKNTGGTSRAEKSALAGAKSLAGGIAGAGGLQQQKSQQVSRHPVHSATKNAPAKIASALAAANSVASSVAKLKQSAQQGKNSSRMVSHGDAAMRDKLAKFAAWKKEARAGEENSAPSFGRGKIVPKHRPVGGMHLQHKQQPRAGPQQQRPQQNNQPRPPSRPFPRLCPCPPP